MLVSKFESLSDEILVHLFQNYIDAIDLVVAFRGQQNQRIDHLIEQCQITRFNFLECRKVKFFYSLHYLSSYEKDIRKLLLGERRTPGQLNAFFNVYPTLDSFENLRYLYMSINLETAEWTKIQRILPSLSKTKLETLVFEMSDPIDPHISSQFLLDALQIPTLKRLQIDAEHSKRFQQPLIRINGQLQSLKLSGFSIRGDDLPALLRLMPHLTSLDIDLAYDHQKSIILLPLIDEGVETLAPLHTLQLFVVSADDHFSTLILNLHRLTRLHHLIVRGSLEILRCIDWRQLHHTSPSDLTYIDIRIIVFSPIDQYLQQLESIDWSQREHVRVIVSQHEILQNRTKSQIMDNRCRRQDFKQPLLQCWTMSNRSEFDLHTFDPIQRLTLCNYWMKTSFDFNNINHLTIHDLNDDLLRWMKDHVNLWNIHHIDLSLLEENHHQICSLLTMFINLRSLRMTYRQVMKFSGKDLVIPKIPIYYLDLATNAHPFNRSDLEVFAHLFPCLEHLTINPESAHCFSMLPRYWPRLRSLTYRFGSNDGHIRLQPDSSSVGSWSIKYETLTKFNTIWVDLLSFYSKAL